MRPESPGATELLPIATGRVVGGCWRRFPDVVEVRYVDAALGLTISDFRCHLNSSRTEDLLPAAARGG